MTKTRPTCVPTYSHMIFNQQPKIFPSDQHLQLAQTGKLFLKKKKKRWRESRMFFWQKRWINISVHILSGDKDRQSRLSWYPLQSASDPFLLPPGERKSFSVSSSWEGHCWTVALHWAVASCQSKEAGKGDCLRHCPPRQSTVGGFVGGGISLSPLTLPGASAASSQYLSAYPSTWTASLNWHTNLQPTCWKIFSVYPTKLVVLPHSAFQDCHLCRK